MAVKNMQVNLQFNANVQNAKAQLRELQNQLSALINNNATSTLGITPQIQEATRSAMDLKIALNNATNVNTGKLNLNKFQSELNRSGKSIQQYAQQLKMLGPEGVKAFNQMASAVASANTKLFNLSGGMKKLSDTLFNTLRWSIASSAIQGVTSAISETISYAKELDTSLNNIRIVTQKSNDEMSKFAETANKMAKALSTTTTKYSDASLIYYQQGLSDKEVKKRTDVTVKLANVVRENAEQVSEWMTAIWNNFDDGSESLEYYADVLAKLGAATASSADEIAGGLEKFAAVADTIGLSYEYAASMLATITAETRQSEDVVGTALKTILSRIEQLSQGKTLDDGTTLGKYSQALLNVGVNIKDINGELKDMDLILQQTGNKWDTLARDQQIALAQSVAGIRQYTQFMALMDNWDVMEQNLAMTESANGALQEQQEIYEDSVEAAQNRMTASAEKIKSTLLDGDDLKGLYDFAGGFLDIVAEMLEAFGGLRTILLGVAVALTKMYQPQLASFMSQMAVSAKDLYSTLRHPIKTMKGETVSPAQRFKRNTIGLANTMSQEMGTTPGEASIRREEAKIQETLLKKEGQMSEGAKQRAEWEVKILATKRDQILAISEAIEKEQEQNSVAQEKLLKGYATEDAQNKVENYLNKRTTLGNAKGAGLIASNLLESNKNIDIQKMPSEDLGNLKNNLTTQMKAMKKETNSLGPEFNDIGLNIDKVIEKINILGSEGGSDIGALLKEVEQLNQALTETSSKNLIDPTQGIIQDMNNTADEANKQAEIAGKNADIIDEANLNTNVDSIRTVDQDNAEKTLKDLRANSAGMTPEQLKDLDKWDKKLADINKKYPKGQRNSKAYRQEIASLNQEINKGGKRFKNYSKQQDDLAKKMKKGAKEAENNSDALKNTANQAENLGSKAQVAEAGIYDLVQEEENLNAKLNNDGFKHWSDSVAAGISNVATYSMGISMLASSFETLFSDIAEGNMTFTGFLSSISMIMMSLGMLVPMVIKGVGAIQKLTEAKHKQKIMADALNDTQEVDLTLQQKSIIMKKMDDGVTQKEIEEDYGEAGAAVVKAYAKNSENAGNPAKWPAFLAGLGMIAPIALMVGVAALSASGSAPTEEEQAIVDEEAAKEQYDNAKSAYDDVKSSLSDYKDSQKAIDELTVGTQEWVEALQNANQQVIELLSKYPELNQFVTTAENGRMTINDEGWAYLSNKKQKEVSMASILSQAASVRRQKVSLDTDQEEYALEFGGVGSVDGFNAEGDDEQWIRDKIDALTTGYLEKGEEVFLGLDEELEGLGDKSGEVAEKIRQLVRQEQQLVIAEENLLQQRVNNVLTDGLGYNSHILTQGVQKHVKDYVKNDKKYQAYSNVDLDNHNMAFGFDEVSSLDDFVNNENWTKDVNNGKLENPFVNYDFLNWGASDYGIKTLEKYFKDMGIDADVNNTDFHEKNISYTTKDGTETTVSYEELLEYEKQKYLESRASELQAMAQKIYATGKKLKASADNVDQAMGEYLESGDLAAIDADVLTNLKNMSEEELRNKLNEYAGTLEDLEMSTEEYVDSIIEQIEGLTKEEVIANRLQREELAYKNTLEQGANGLGMDKNALDAYAQSLMKANGELAKNKSQAAQVAVEHYKLGKGLNEVRKALEKNIDTLKAANKNSLEYAEALGAIKTAIDKAFGSDVSFEFIEKEMGNIQDMLNGSVKAYNKVRKALVKDWIKNLELDESQIKQIDTLFDRLMKKANEGATEIEIGVNDQPAIDSINNLVQKGLIAEEELAAAFRNANLEWGEGTTFTTYTLPSQTKSYSSVRDKDGNDIYTIETTNETSQTLPWIGDNPPQFKSLMDTKSFADATTITNADGSTEKVTWMAADSAGNYNIEVTEDNYEEYKNSVLKKKGSGVNSKGWSINTQKTYVGSSALTYNEKPNESKEDKKKRQRELNDELERYHEIEEVLDDISKLQDKISKAKDRAFGAKKVALINAEVKALEAQEKALDKNIEKAKNYLELDKKEAAKYGLKFDAATGNLTNYEELQQKYLNKLGSMDPNNSNYEKVEAEYEAFKAAAKKYEETYDTWEDKMEQKAENIRAQLDAKLEGVSYSIELKYKINDRELAKAERALERLQRDDDYDRAEAITIIGQSTGAAEKDLKAAQQGLRETLEVAKVNKKDIEAYMAGNADALAKYDLDSNVIEKVEEYTDKALDAYATIEENEQAVIELISDNFDHWHEKISAIGEKLESYQSIMENYTNIIDLVGAKTLGISNDMLKQMEKATMQAAQAQVGNAKAVMDTTKAALDEARKNANDESLTESQRKAYDKEAERLEAQLLKDTANFTSVWASTIELAYETFDKETQRAIEEFGKTLTNGFGSMQEYVDEFEWQQEKDDWFVEGYEKAYELSKLTRDLNKQLDKTQNVKNQKMLAQLQEEIAAYQKAGVEMSEHDLDILRKRYNLKLAEIALEEAQNAKSTVRLQRDSEGNYGYVYTADQNNIDQAQQNYEDKLFAMQQTNDQYLNDLQSKVVTNRQEMVNALANLNYSDYANAEAYEKAKNEIIERYSAREQYLLQEMQKTIDYNTLVYNNDVLNYGSYVGQHEAISNEWVMHFRDTTIAQMGYGYEDLKGFHEKLNEALGNATDDSTLLGQTAAAMDDLEAHIEKIFGEAGLDINNFKDATKTALNGDSDSVLASSKTFEKYMLEVMYGKGGSASNPSSDSVVGGIKSAEDATKEYAENAKKSFPAISQEVSTWYKTYGPTLQKGKKDTENLDEALTSLFEKEDWKISAGVDISSADIKAVRNLTDALDKLTTEVNNMSSKAININVNYKTSGGGTTPPKNPDTPKNPVPPKNSTSTTKRIGGNVISGRGGNTMSLGGQTYFQTSNNEWYNVTGKKSISGASGWVYYDVDKTSTAYGTGTHPWVNRRVYLASDIDAFYLTGAKGNMYLDRLNYDWALRSYAGKNRENRNKPVVMTKNGTWKVHDMKIANAKKWNNQWYFLMNKKSMKNYQNANKNSDAEIRTDLGALWLREDQIIGTYDTGGYTGEWGPEGRMAMLHQKEIVLNAHDTENFLTAIEIVRSIANQMNLNNQKLSEYATSSTRLPKTKTETLQQEVTIHAEFPNATNHNEIEEAFGNLVNLAAQYTNRK